MHHYQRVGLAVIAMLLLGGGVSVAASSSSSSPRQAARRFFAPSLARHFAVFAQRHGSRVRSVRGAVDTAQVALPATVAKSFDDPAQASQNFGPDASAAVYEAPRPGSSFGFWVVPGSNGSCLVWETTEAQTPVSHAACAPLGPVSNGGLSQIASVNGQNVIFGLVVNGTTSVAVHNTDGSTAWARVANNAYVIEESAGTPHSVSSTDSVGNEKTLLSLG